MSTEPFAIGIDFGGTKMLGAAVDVSGNVFAEVRVSTPYDPEALFDAIAKIVCELETELGASSCGVGIGAAGLVDRSGQYHFGPNVGGVRGLDVVGELTHRLGQRTFIVENDNTCATWGECRLGAGRDRDEVAFVGLGTGIGGGIVTSGRLYRGRNGFSGEFGHMTIVTNGVACVCGKSGCWEAYASGRALGRLGRESAARGESARLIDIAGSVEQIRGEHVSQAAREGNAGALTVMRTFSRWLAVGLANVIAILDPEAVVVGGGLADDADLYFAETQAILTALVFGADSRPSVPVLTAELGPRAAVVGAALLAHGQTIPI